MKTVSNLFLKAAHHRRRTALNLIKDICRCVSYHCNDLPFDQTSLLGKKINQMNNVLRVKKKKIT